MSAQTAQAEMVPDVPALLLASPPCAPRLVPGTPRRSANGACGWQFPKLLGSWSYAPHRLLGILSEEPLQFANQINRPVGDTTRAQQPARGESVQRSWTDADCLGRFNSVQPEFWRLRRCKFRSEERRVGKECRSRWSPY